MSGKPWLRSDIRYISSWVRQFQGAGDGRRKAPGEFDLPHSPVFDEQGLLYAARHNGQIQAGGGGG
jgi:hypothetical protein